MFKKLLLEDESPQVLVSDFVTDMDKGTKLEFMELLKKYDEDATLDSYYSKGILDSFLSECTIVENEDEYPELPELDMVTESNAEELPGLLASLTEWQINVNKNVDKDILDQHKFNNHVQSLSVALLAVIADANGQSSEPVEEIEPAESVEGVEPVEPVEEIEPITEETGTSSVAGYGNKFFEENKIESRREMVTESAEKLYSIVITYPELDYIVIKDTINAMSDLGWKNKSKNQIEDGVSTTFEKTISDDIFENELDKAIDEISNYEDTSKYFLKILQNGNKFN